MSQFLKQAVGIVGGLNAIADTTPSGQTDIFGALAEYGGGVAPGDYLRLNDAEALALSNTTVGTLFGGVYRRVLLKSGITGGGNTGFKRGQLVFWDPVTSGANNYQVTNVEATDPAMMAGVIINATDTALLPLSGKWVWIQTDGLFTMQYIATVTDTNVGSVVVWAKAGAGADNAQVDALATGTTVTDLVLTKYIGIAVEAPTNGGLKKVIGRGLFAQRI